MKLPYSVLDHDMLWKLLKSLIELERPVKISELCEQYNTGSGSIVAVVNFLREMSCDIQIGERGEDKVIVPAQLNKNFKIELNLYEWILLQSSFPQLGEQEQGQGQRQSDLHQLLARVENDFEDIDLFDSVDLLSGVQFDSHKSSDDMIGLEDLEEQDEISYLASQVDMAMANGHALECYMDNGELYKIVPYQMMQTPDSTLVFGQNIIDNELIQITLEQVDFLKEYESDKLPQRFDQQQLEEFIASFAVASSSKIRIILKLSNPEVVDFNPDGIEIERPYMVQTFEGQYIWAAYVNVNETLFDWLLSFGQVIQILEPQNLQEHYLDYCEENLKKIAS